MVSLTSLLVLSSLFQQTSKVIPKTAYFKLIDVWYITLISFDVLIIIIVVMIDNINKIKKHIVIKVAPINEKNDTKSIKCDSYKWNYRAQIILPIMILTFILCFYFIGKTNFKY